ncbi:putative alcohol dehydrogenase [Emericellopsis cladophorae]|uniref:Alcohol dehydrogenase n=1 Tax=Emericellopsis cladophorae TaxID=2686198 RepID=A0A9P9XZ77_9HYPO|nr:putative alcohol dehydrogenase [Emericellopsis cladophorae]KAI6780609.1 putative alcohol dehydrogenase [Emericellopsis cladophorae]
MATHRASVSPAKGQPFEIQHRSTPKPGPGELLIAVKSIAINPADVRMRDEGLYIPKHPAVLGFDLAGLVVDVGEDVPSHFQRGVTRVAAYSAFMWKPSDENYGAFQEKCLVPWQQAIPLADASLSWHHAATLPVAVQVPLCAWDALGISRLGEVTSPPSSGKSEALLVWGASSSVGTMGVQTASLLRDDRNSPFSAVYATAGSSNVDYVASLGADCVFDYKGPQVADTIVAKAKENGLVIRHCFLATGQLAACQAVLKAFVPSCPEKGARGTRKAKIASAPLIPPHAESVDGVETVFVMPSMDEKEGLKQFEYWFGTYLKDKLAQGKIRPSPEPTTVGKGLEAINVGLDQMTKGVSCTKLVVEMSE